MRELFALKITHMTFVKTIRFRERDEIMCAMALNQCLKIWHLVPTAINKVLNKVSAINK